MQMRKLTHEQKTMAREAHLSFPACFPLFDSPVDAKALRSWVLAHDSAEMDRFPGVTVPLKALVEKLAHHVHYVPFSQFFSQLQITLQSFQEAIQEKDYILWITQPYSSQYIQEGCSELWVASLALGHTNLRWPKAIVNSDELVHTLLGNPKTPILTLDDASYSANHLCNELKNIMTHVCTKYSFTLDELKNVKKKIFDRTLWMGVLFMTKHAEKSIKGASLFRETQLLPHSILELISDILDEKEKQSYTAIAGSPGKQTLTYFSHRFPDCYSTAPYLETGFHIISPSKMIKALEIMGVEIPAHPEAKNALIKKKFEYDFPIIPVVVPIYKLHALEKKARLKEAILKERIGQRTLYSVPKNLPGIRELLQYHGIFSHQEEKEEEDSEVKRTRTLSQGNSISHHREEKKFQSQQITEFFGPPLERRDYVKMGFVSVIVTVVMYTNFRVKEEPWAGFLALLFGGFCLAAQMSYYIPNSLNKPKPGG